MHFVTTCFLPFLSPFGQFRSFVPNAAKPTQLNGTGEAGQGTLEAWQLHSADSEAGGPCSDSATDVN